MSRLRQRRTYKPWTSEEIEILRHNYATSSWLDLYEMLPGRTDTVMRDKANSLGVIRSRPEKRNAEQVRQAKREGMRRFYARLTPEQKQEKGEYRRSYYLSNRVRINQHYKSMHAARFFWSRAKKVRPITANHLWSIWKRQRGKCALTGRTLTRDNAHLDHIIPLARGGTHEVGNLRWVCEQVNIAKRDMLDEEFFQLCKEVIAVPVLAWIGKRIVEVDAQVSE